MRNQFECKLKLYGYRGLDKSQLRKQSVTESRELIKGIELPDSAKISDSSISTKNLTRQSKKTLISLFPDLNRDIRVISINDYYKLAVKLQTGALSIPAYIETLKKTSFIGDVCSLPINFHKDFSCVIGETLKPMALVDDDYYLNNTPICVSGFNIGSIGLSRLGVITHLHEMTHALLERNKGSVQDYYKSELLSILIEKIGAYEIDKTSILLSKQNIFRYENLKQCINKSNNSDDTHKYLLSTLLAEALFNKYENGSEAYRNHLLAQIHKVLSGELVLENMLRNEGITLDNSNLPCLIDENIQKSVRNLK